MILSKVDIGTYLVARYSSQEMALLQILDLYREGYVDIDRAKRLARKYARDLASSVLWTSLRRDQAFVKEGD